MSPSFPGLRPTSPATSECPSSSSTRRSGGHASERTRVGRGPVPRAPPFLESSAKLERIGVPGGDVADASHIYVARLRLPRPGTYWLLAEPEGRRSGALGNVVVVESDSAWTSVTLRSRRIRLRSPPRAATSRSSRPARRPTSRCWSTRSPTRFDRGCRSSSRSRRRSSAPAVRAVRSSTSWRRSPAGSRAGRLASSTSRSTRGTTRRRVSTAGCGVGPRDRALDVPRRRRRQDRRALRRRGFGERAPRPP